MKHLAEVLYSLCLLQLGGGTVAAQDSAKFHGTAVDSVYSEFPYIRRVYNWGSNKVADPSVPFVELDTNTYEKKLWLSDKKVLSPPIKSKHARIVALDSVVYVAYSVHDGTAYLYSTFSLDYGATWTSPYFIQQTGYASGNCLLIDEQRVYLAYPTSASFGEDLIEELLFRKTDADYSALSDSVVVDTNSSWSEFVYVPDLLWWGDTLFLSYFYYHDDADYFRFTKSDDQGIAGLWSVGMF